MKRFIRTSAILVGLSINMILGTSVQADDMQSAVGEFNALHFAKAKQLFFVLANDKSHKDAANYYLGRIALGSGDYDAAREYLDASIAIEPNSADEYYWLAATCGALLQRPANATDTGLGLCYFQNLEAAVTVDPGHVLALTLLYQFSVNNAESFGAVAEGAAQLLKQLETASRPDADVARLFALNHDKEWTKAVSLAQTMVAAYPDSERALLEAGKTLSINKRYAEALKAFESVTSRTPTILNRHTIQGAYLEIGHLSLRSNADLDRGIAALTRAVNREVFPVNANTNWAYWRLAQLSQLKGDAAQQKKYLALLETTGVQKGALLIKDMKL